MDTQTGLGCGNEDKPGYLSYYIFQVRLLQAERGIRWEGHSVTVAHNVLAGKLRKEGT